MIHYISYNTHIVVVLLQTVICWISDQKSLSYSIAGPWKYLGTHKDMCVPVCFRELEGCERCTCKFTPLYLTLFASHHPLKFSPRYLKLSFISVFSKPYYQEEGFLGDLEKILSSLKSKELCCFMQAEDLV